MLIIDENKISLTRGDTAYLYVDLGDYEASPEDTMTLTVRKQLSDNDPVLTLTIVAGEAFVIKPEDTRDLEYGKYLYDVQLNTHLGEVFTVVAKTAFKLTEEVTLP